MRGDRAAAAELAKKWASTAGAGAAVGAIPTFFIAAFGDCGGVGGARRPGIRTPAQPSLKEMLLAYALLLDGKAAAAAAPLERARDLAGTGADEGIAVLLAWSKVEGGDAAGAVELLRFNPIPQLTGPQAFAGLLFSPVVCATREGRQGPWKRKQPGNLQQAARDALAADRTTWRRLPGAANAGRQPCGSRPCACWLCEPRPCGSWPCEH